MRSLRRALQLGSFRVACSLVVVVYLGEGLQQPRLLQLAARGRCVGPSAGRHREHAGRHIEAAGRHSLLVGEPNSDSRHRQRLAVASSRPITRRFPSRGLLLHGLPVYALLPSSFDATSRSGTDTVLLQAHTNCCLKYECRSADEQPILDAHFMTSMQVSSLTRTHICLILLLLGGAQAGESICRVLIDGIYVADPSWT